MSETNYFWQGGRKIPVQKDVAEITIQAPSEAAARGAAERAGVQLSAVSAATPNRLGHQRESAAWRLSRHTLPRGRGG